MYDTFTNAESWASAMELCVPASALSGLTLSGPEMFNGPPLLEDQHAWRGSDESDSRNRIRLCIGCHFFAWFKKENGGQNMISILYLQDFQTAE